MNIKELKSNEDIQSSFFVMKELRTDLNESEYMNYIGLMQKEGYRLFGLYDGDQLIVVSGLSILTNLYYKRHIWVYDLVTAETHRSKGYGLHLMKFIEELAHKEGCQTIALSSGLERVDAHRFYIDKLGYSKPSYVFKKYVRTEGGSQR